MKQRSAFRKKLSAVRKAVQAYRAYVGGPFPRLRALWFLAPRLGRMGALVYFAPSKADPQYLFRQIMALLGYKATDDPEDRAVLSLKWIDDTYPVADHSTLELASSRRLMNVGTWDISKDRVSELMEQVFGYTATIDPTQFEGQAVKKGNLNATEEASIVECPIDRASVDPDAVYQEVLGPDLLDGWIQEHRVTWLVDRIVTATERLRLPEQRFEYDGAQISVVRVQDIYTADESRRIAQFAKAMKLDYGDIETMRDSRGRLHVLDVNPTPWSRLMYGRPTPGSPALVQIAKALERLAKDDLERPLQSARTELASGST
ncbi:MAG: hypothetical protein ACR2QM_13575 [Longimicrobiales bacterium]